MKPKAFVIEGKLVRLDENGKFYRLNGVGKWNEIKPKDLYNLINTEDEK